MEISAPSTTHSVTIVADGCPLLESRKIATMEMSALSIRAALRRDASTILRIVIQFMRVTTTSAIPFGRSMSRSRGQGWCL
jgi:hypothetical protein